MNRFFMVVQVSMVFEAPVPLEQIDPFMRVWATDPLNFPEEFKNRFRWMDGKEVNKSSVVSLDITQVDIDDDAGGCGDVATLKIREV